MIGDQPPATADASDCHSRDVSLIFRSKVETQEACMKFFLDTANLDEIRKAAALGLADGVTTNPTLVAKEGNVDFKEHIGEICKIVSGPVSAEVTSPNKDDMLREG